FLLVRRINDERRHYASFSTMYLLQYGDLISKQSPRSLSSTATSSIRELKKDQKKLLSTKEKEELNSSFISKLLVNIEALDSTGINLRKVKSPTDYKQLLGG
ncbi:hypothetical protein ACSLOB_28450, partial [Escherichia coli]